MQTSFYSSAIVIVMAVWIGSILAVPTLPTPAISNTTTDSSDEKISSKSRQLVVNANNAPTAATGLSNANLSSLQNPLQAFTLIQQVTKSGNNPIALAAELGAQQQEAFLLQNQNKQQGLLAAVQSQQDQVATVQAAITNQSHMVNGHPKPGGISLAALNPATQQLQQQLDLKRQQLLLQQQLLKQQAKPETQQMTSQQILIAQLLREPASKRPQLLEQIKQTVTKQEAENLINPYSQQRPTSVQPSRAEQEMLRYKMLMQLLGMANQGGNPSQMGYNIDPTRAVMPGASAGIPMIGDMVASQMQQQVQQMLLLQRQQQYMMLLQQQQLAMNPMLNPYMAMF